MAQGDTVRNMEWAVLELRIPGCNPVSAGILLVDLASDQLYVKLLPELSTAEDEVVEFWCELPQGLIERSKAVGGYQVLRWLEDTASHLVQLGPRSVEKASDPENQLESLYRHHVIAASGACGFRRKVNGIRG
jgi:hypothetical protein